MTRCLLSGAPTPYFRASRINRRKKTQKTDQQADKSSRSKEGPTHTSLVIVLVG
jgi:hypothetical protein